MERSYVSIDERNARLGRLRICAGAISDGRPYLDNWVAGAPGDPGIFGWRESDSMAAYHRHMDETPTIYSMAVIYELPGVQSCAESRIA